MYKKFTSLGVLGFLGLLISLQGCRKESALGIDNDSVVKIPFSLYASNDRGWLIHSNNGHEYVNVFPPDGYPISNIVLADSNLLVMKNILHLSSNNGKNFNPVYTNINKKPWKSNIYPHRSHQAVYVASNMGKGIAISEDWGETWKMDENWQVNIPPQIEITSFAGLANGSLFCYSNVGNVTFKKASIKEYWTPVTTEGVFPVLGSEFYLVSARNTLYMVDYNGLGGVWFSENEGLKYERFEQGHLPKNITYYCGVSPFGGRNFIVGTSHGAFRVNADGVFVAATIGFEKGTEVYDLTVKRNIYKNDVVKTYVFAATNNGIYRSEDAGQSWAKVTDKSQEGNFTAIN